MITYVWKNEKSGTGIRGVYAQTIGIEHIGMHSRLCDSAGNHSFKESIKLLNWVAESKRVC